MVSQFVLPAVPLFLAPELLILPASVQIMKSQTNFHSLMNKMMRNITA